MASRVQSGGALRPPWRKGALRKQEMVIDRKAKQDLRSCFRWDSAAQASSGVSWANDLLFSARAASQSPLFFIA